MSLCISVASLGLVASDKLGHNGYGHITTCPTPKYVIAPSRKFAILHTGLRIANTVLARKVSEMKELNPMRYSTLEQLERIEEAIKATMVEVEDTDKTENDFTVLLDGVNYTYQRNHLLPQEQDVVANGMGFEMAQTYLDLQGKVTEATVRASIEYVSANNLYVGNGVFLDIL